MFDNIDPVGAAAVIIVVSIVIGYIYEKWSGTGGGTSKSRSTSKSTGRAERSSRKADSAKSRSKRHRRSE